MTIGGAPSPRMRQCSFRMNRAWQAVMLLAVIAVVGCGGGGGDTKRGDAGSPQRIVSLAPSITETLFALGLGDRVVGVTRFCAWPPEARTRPSVGGYLDLSYEAVAGLSPDLVLLLPEHSQARDALATMGIPSLTVGNRTIAEIIATIRTIADSCGVPERGRVLADSCQSVVDTVARRTAGAPRTRTLVIVGRTLGAGNLSDIYAAGRGTFYDELITAAGGENVVSAGGPQYPLFGVEGLLSLDPEVIIDLIPPTGDTVPDSARAAADWLTVSILHAVRTGRVHEITAGYAVIPGPRFTLLLDDVVAMLHPELVPTGATP